MSDKKSVKDVLETIVGTVKELRTTVGEQAQQIRSLESQVQQEHARVELLEEVIFLMLSQNVEDLASALSAPNLPDPVAQTLRQRYEIAMTSQARLSRTLFAATYTPIIGEDAVRTIFDELDVS